MLKKINLKLILLVFASLTLINCAGTGTKNYGSINYEAPTDQAVVFVGRVNRYIASAGLVSIVLDGEEIGKLGIGEMERLNVSPGSHKIQTKIGNILQVGVGGDATAFVAKEGKKYFFLVDYDAGLFSAKWKIIETTESGFQGSLN